MTDADFDRFCKDLSWEYRKADDHAALYRFCVTQKYEDLHAAAIKFASTYEGRFKPSIGSLIKTLRGMTQGATDTTVPPDEAQEPDLPRREAYLTWTFVGELQRAEIPRDRLAAVKRYMDARDSIGKPVEGAELENMQELIAKNDAEGASNALRPPGVAQIPALPPDAPGASSAPASTPVDECEAVMGPDMMQQGEKWESPL